MELIHIDKVVEAMQRRDGKGESVRFSCEYIKSNGVRIELNNVRIIRYNKEEDTVQVLVAGGVRKLRLFAITRFNGAEVFI